MAADAGLKIPIGGDITPLLAEFGKLPGRTKTEMDAVAKIIDDEMSRGNIAKAFAEMPNVAGKNAKRMANMVHKEVQRMAREAEAAAKEMAREAERAAKQAQAAIERAKADAERDAKSRRGDLRQGAGAIFGSGIVNDIGDIAAAATALGPAGVALGTIGVAAVGAGVAIAGVGKAAYEVTEILYNAALATGKLADENRALEVAQQRVSQALASETVPTFEGLTIGATAAALALADLIEAEEKGVRVILDWNDEQSDFVKGIIAGALPVVAHAAAVRDLTRGLDDGTISLGGYADKARQLRDTLATIDFRRGADQGAIDAAEEARRRMEAEARRVAAVGRERIAMKKREQQDNEREREKALKQNETDEEKAYAAELKGYANRIALRAQISDYRESRAAADVAIEAQYQQDLVDLEVDAAERRQRQADEAKEAYNQAFNAAGGILDIVTRATEYIIDQGENGTDEQKKAAKTAWDLQQAAAVANIGIAGIEMGMRLAASMAALGPIGIAAAVGIAGAQTGIAIAGIAAADPPKFHQGFAPDEQPAMLTRGEGVLTPRAVNDLGGPQAVTALNRGQGSQKGPVEVVTKWRGRVIDRVLTDVVKAKGPSSTYKNPYR